MSAETRWTELKSVEGITDEIAAIVRSVVEGWYPAGQIDWHNVWDRVDGAVLDDGTKLSLPGDMTSPVFRELKKIGKEAQAE